MNQRAVLFILAWTVTATGLSAQDSALVAGHWSIGVSGSFDVCYRTLEITEENEHTERIVEWRDDFEVQRNSYTFGVDLEYAANQHWSFATGMQFSDRGFGTEEIDLIASDPEAFVLGTLYEQYHYRFISFPFMIRYSIRTGAWRFRPATGVWIDRLHEHFVAWTITHQDGTQNSGRMSESYVDFEEWGATACVELPLSYSVCDRVELRCGPRARYQFTDLTNTPITAHLWEGGILFGVLVHL